MPGNDNILSEIGVVPLVGALQDPPPINDTTLWSWLLQIRDTVDENSETLRRSLVAVSRHLERPNTTITSTTYTATDDDYLILADATGGSITITLPPAADVLHHDFIVKRLNAGGNTVIVNGDGSETIDEASAPCFTLTAQYDAIRVISDGTEWWIY